MVLGALAELELGVLALTLWVLGRSPCGVVGALLPVLMAVLLPTLSLLHLPPPPLVLKLLTPFPLLAPLRGVLLVL